MTVEHYCDVHGFSVCTCIKVYPEFDFGAVTGKTEIAEATVLQDLQGSALFFATEERSGLSFDSDEVNDFATQVLKLISKVQGLVED